MSRPIIPEYMGSPPIRGQNEQTYTDNANDFVIWLSDSAPLMTQLGAWFEDRGDIAEQVLGNANTASDMALAAVNFVGRWTDQSGALATGKSVSHEGMIWVAEQDIADVTLSEPAFDNPDWITISGNYVEDRTTNVSLRVYDIGKILYLNGTFTQTIEDIDLLPVGWFVYLRNVGSDVITVDPFEAQTIEGQASLDIHPGQTVTIIRAETEFRLLLNNGAYEQIVDSSATIDVPVWAADAFVEAWSAGAGGDNNDGTGTSEACGGASGEYVSGWFKKSQIGESILCTIGSGGDGAASGATNAFGSAGGDTQFGSLLQAKAAPQKTGAGSVASLPRVGIVSRTILTEIAERQSPSSFGLPAGSRNASDPALGPGAGGNVSRNSGGVSSYEKSGSGGDGASGGAPGGNGTAPGGGGGTSDTGGGGDGAPGRIRILWF